MYSGYVIFDTPCNFRDGETFIFQTKVNQKLFTKYSVWRKIWNISIGIISVENDWARQLNLSKIINNFAKKKHAQTKFLLNILFICNLNSNKNG